MFGRVVIASYSESELASLCRILGKSLQPLGGLHALATVLFKVIGLIINLAPIGVFGAVAFTAGKYGAASLSKLFLQVIVFYVSCVIFVVLVLGTIMRIAGFNIFQLIDTFAKN